MKFEWCESRCVVEYPVRYPQFCVNGVAPTDVLSALEERSKGSVPVSGVPKAVQLRGVDVSSVRARSVGVRSVSSLRLLSLRPESAFASSTSPREVLAFAMKELRRAAEAKKGSRIAKRLAALAEGKCERASSWSSRKSLRGVC